MRAAVACAMPVDVGFLAKDNTRCSRDSDFLRGCISLQVVQLNMLAKRMRTARMQAAEGGGAIQSGRCDPDFRLREGKVVLEGGGGGGGGGGGSAAVGEEGQESHQLIEEFMLLANKLVAEKLLKAAPAHCLLRAHPPPRTSKLLDWCRLAYECGFKPPVRACRTSAQTDMQLLAGTK
eukprot:SAG11_NODE_50_length_19992_cov_9.945157_25_plen_178_part_00